MAEANAPITDMDLIGAAVMAQRMAYVPYSRFKVGAAVLADDGQIYTGSNIENASFGASVCAEQVAIFKAVSTGVRKIKRLAVITDADEYARPCGICRQVIQEFAAPDFTLIAIKPDLSYQTLSLEDLLPGAFGMDSLNKAL
jgi:cytidine deaminase